MKIEQSIELAADNQIELDKIVIYDKIITVDAVEKIVGFKKSKIYKLMKTGEFPKKHPYAPGWVLSAILLYVRTGKVDSISCSSSNLI